MNLNKYPLLKEIIKTAAQHHDADILINRKNPDAFHGERLGYPGMGAGKALALSRAIGLDPSFSIKHPFLFKQLMAIGGAGLGAAPGLIGIAETDDPFYINPAILGSVGGAVAGTAAGRYLNRRQIRKVMDRYNDTPSKDIDLNLTRPNGKKAPTSLSLINLNGAGMPINSRAGEWLVHNNLHGTPVPTSANRAWVLGY